MGFSQPSPSSLQFESPAGPLTLTLLGHASIRIDFDGLAIYVDPWSRVADFDAQPKADWIWLTHDHPDHLDLEAIAAVERDGTRFLADPSSAEKLGRRDGVVVMRNGDRKTMDGIEVEAVPAYNLVRSNYHPRGKVNGYLATFGGLRVYVAADTECIPEMKRLQHVDVAFVPINLPYTMSPEEAAGCLKIISPRVAVPYHHGDVDPGTVRALLEGSGIEVRVLS